METSNIVFVSIIIVMFVGFLVWMGQLDKKSNEKVEKLNRKVSLLNQKLLISDQNMDEITALNDRIDESESRVDAFFNLCPDILCVADKNKIVATNNSWTKILGWEVSEVVGQEWRKFIHEDYMDDVENIVKVMYSEEIIDIDVGMKTKDGDIRVITWRSTGWINGLTYSVGRDHAECERRLQRISTSDIRKA